MVWFQRILITVLVLLILDIYAFFAVSKAVPYFKRNIWVYVMFSNTSIALLAAIYALVSIFLFGVRPNSGIFRVLITVSIFILSPKIALTLVLLIEDLIRWSIALYRYILHIISPKEVEVAFLESRKKFISQLALGVASIPFLYVGYGVFRGRYNFKVIKKKLFFENLPLAFDGLKVLQISDAHVGSFNSPEDVARGISMINEQKADVVCFTGDFVNNVATELDDWKSLFSQIKAKYKFSILGNHDYGDYFNWDSEEDKQENLKKLFRYQEEMGFDLLRNESRHIEKEGESIAFVGVENWGLRGFQKYGDLDIALENVSQESFKILLSHDPTHWEAQVKSHPKNLDLTLSGHTHGMQMGIEVKGFRWSPAKYIYKHWAGMYSQANKYLYVNRGFGYLGVPMRAGIWPEITVIELKKKMTLS